MRDVFDKRNLKRLPNYRGPHARRYAKSLKESKLNIDKATSFYGKLKDYLAISNEVNSAFDHKEQSALFSSNWKGWHEIKWMPRLGPNWYRLSFRLFCIFYGIEERSGE